MNSNERQKMDGTDSDGMTEAVDGCMKMFTEMWQM